MKLISWKNLINLNNFVEFFKNTYQLKDILPFQIREII
jgi:hypothetical protein